MIHYYKKGQGKSSVIFLHGNSSSSKYWYSAFTAELQEKYTLYSLDLPGHGNSFVSENPESEYTFKGISKFVDDFLINEINGEYIIIGHSLGCNIIAELSCLDQKCNGILLTSPSIIAPELNISDISLPNPNVGILFSEKSQDQDLEAFIEDVSVNFNNNSKDDIKNDYFKTDPKFRPTLLNSIIKGEFSDQIKSIFSIGVPVGIVFGEKDTLCNIQYLNDLDLNVYNNEIIVLKNAGHYLQFDQANEMNQIINEFVLNCSS